MKKTRYLQVKHLSDFTWNDLSGIVWCVEKCYILKLITIFKSWAPNTSKASKNCQLVSNTSLEIKEKKSLQNLCCNTTSVNLEAEQRSQENDREHLVKAPNRCEPWRHRIAQHTLVLNNSARGGSRLQGPRQRSRSAEERSIRYQTDGPFFSAYPKYINK